jgi:hypothetical protein
MQEKKMRKARLVKGKTARSNAATVRNNLKTKTIPKNKKRVEKSTFQPSKSSSSKLTPTPSPSAPSSKPSKQATVLAMLRRTDGATIIAIEEATGWKPHSIRGFLAGVVRKKLNLNLTSERVDGERRYRVIGSEGTR